MNFEFLILIKVTLILITAGLLSAVMRRASASARHVVWASALFATLAVPAASRLLPPIELAVLPIPTVTSAIPAPASAVEPTFVEISQDAPTRVPQQPLHTKWSARTWLMFAWGLGAVVVAAGWLVAVLSLYRLKRRSQPIDDGPWIEQLEDVAQRIGVRSSVRLRIANEAVPPMTWGIFRPVILLPAAARQWADARRRLVLAHELAHVKRNDGVGQFLAQLACSFYWFNPVVWVAVHRLYVERERACDDAVLRLGAPATDYADHLLQIARGMNSRFALTAVAMAHPSELKSRITAILQSGIRRQRASRIFVAGLLSVIAGLALFMATLQLTTLAAMTLPLFNPLSWTPEPVRSLEPAPVQETLRAPAPLFTLSTSPSIDGIVVNSSTADPVPGAGVELIPVSGDGKPVAIATSAEGRFVFDNLTPGEYRLASARPGYVRTEFGQRNATGVGRTLTIKANQGASNIRIELPETASITGSVRGRNGTPLANVQVQAVKYAYKDERRVLTTLRSVMTNDLGEYRLFWLPPGEYLVTATLLAANAPGRIMEVIPGGTANRAIADPSGEAILVPNDDASIPFYFPNTVDPARAEALVLHAAEKRGSVDFTIAAPTAWRVRGVVLNLPAPAANAGEPFAPAPRIRIVPAVASVASESAPVGLASFDRKTGAFEIPGVLPGTYDVFASFGNVHGRVSVQVAAADVENVRVTLVPDFDVNAQVNAEGFAANDIARMQIRLNPDYVGPARRLPTGLFQWRGVSAETHHTVAVDQLPEGAYVKSVRMGTLDILASGFRIGLAPEAPIEITLGTGGSISGTMEKLEPGATAFVVIVPDSPYRGRADLYRNTRTDSSGRYRISGIAPGNYHIFAWESVEEGAWRYADFIRRYEERGKAIHIDEGAIQTLQLQVIP